MNLTNRPAVLAHAYIPNLFYSKVSLGDVTRDINVATVFNNDAERVEFLSEIGSKVITDNCIFTYLE